MKNCFSPFAVYPRWRGEHTICGANFVIWIGLSPLARGTHCPFVGEGHASRFIPAGAGNTRSASRLWFALSVYPRWRGEHSVVNYRDVNGNGLSPLARGTLGRVGWMVKKSRFIPAGAGNTAQWAANACQLPVYPRWRGEHDVCSA